MISSSMYLLTNKSLTIATEVSVLKLYFKPVSFWLNINSLVNNARRCCRFLLQIKQPQ